MNKMENELYSIALWSIRRMKSKSHKLTALYELEETLKSNGSEAFYVQSLIRQVKKNGNF